MANHSTNNSLSALDLANHSTNNSLSALDLANHSTNNSLSALDLTTHLPALDLTTRAKRYHERDRVRREMIIDFFEDKWFLKSLDLSSRLLRRLFGGPDHKYGRYLFNQLLVRQNGSTYCNPRYAKTADAKSKCHTYIFNKKAYREMVGLAAMIETHKPDRISALRAKYHLELLGIKPIIYKESSDRLWMGALQNCDAKKEKPYIFAGYLNFNYDLSTAAATVLLETTLRVYPPSQRWIGGLLSYVENKDELRQEVMTATGCSQTNAKEIITGLLNGAILSPIESNWICMMVTEIGVYKLRDKTICPHLYRFRAACRLAWKIMVPGYRVECMKRGVKIPATKYGIYFREERRIMDVVCRYLDSLGIIYFREHDGVRTNSEIDVDHVTDLITDEIGYRVRLEAKHDVVFVEHQCKQ